MVNIVMSVFVGGALGAMLREFTMLMVPNLVDNFPLDILVANLVAAFLLGLVAALASQADRVRRCRDAGRHRHCRRTVNIFELCLWRSRADVGLDGKRRRRVSLCRDQSGAGLHRSCRRTEARRTRLSMIRSPAREETLVFIGYTHVSSGGPAARCARRDWAAADQFDLDRASGKRDD